MPERQTRTVYVIHRRMGLDSRPVAVRSNRRKAVDEAAGMALDCAAISLIPASVVEYRNGPDTVIDLVEEGPLATDDLHVLVRGLFTIARMTIDGRRRQSS